MGFLQPYSQILSNTVVFCDGFGKNPQLFTENGNDMLYNGGGKTREVKHGKDLSGQLHSSRFLVTSAVFVSCRCNRKETLREKKNRKNGNSGTGMCNGGCGIGYFDIRRRK